MIKEKGGLAPLRGGEVPHVPPNWMRADSLASADQRLRAGVGH